MAWARYDDMLPMNRKWVTGLRPMGTRGAAALGLHLLANAWSRHNGTGGRIDTGALEMLVGREGVKLAALLVQVGMFDLDGNGWRIHDFADFSDPNDPEPNRSAGERRKELIEKRREAGRLGGLAPRKQTGSNANDLLPSKREANGKQVLSPVPVPDPVPVTDQVATQLPPPTECPDGGGGPVDNRADSVAAEYARMAVTNARGVTNPKAYSRKAANTCKADPELHRLLGMFPTAPASAVAAWLHGDKGSQQYYPRTDELPTTTEDSTA